MNLRKINIYNSHVVMIKNISDKYEYGILEGKDNHRTLQIWLSNNEQLSRKIIIIPLIHCYKFITGVDFNRSKHER